MFQSSVRINVGPNVPFPPHCHYRGGFQSSVRINVGPNKALAGRTPFLMVFQSSVRINVGPNDEKPTITVELCSSFNPP